MMRLADTISHSVWKMKASSISSAVNRMLDGSEALSLFYCALFGVRETESDGSSAGLSHSAGNSRNLSGSKVKAASMK